ncbi:hypothetical protein BDB13_4338 [Rhodococcus sp. OK302]|nr:hypothetical protein BDB13_4338 [Rhodococcus sp. OK302]
MRETVVISNIHYIAFEFAFRIHASPCCYFFRVILSGDHFPGHYIFSQHANLAADIIMFRPFCRGRR